MRRIVSCNSPFSSRPSEVFAKCFVSEGERLLSGLLYLSPRRACQVCGLRSSSGRNGATSRSLCEVCREQGTYFFEYLIEKKTEPGGILSWRRRSQLAKTSALAYNFFICRDTMPISQAITFDIDANLKKCPLPSRRDQREPWRFQRQMTEHDLLEVVRLRKAQD